MRAPTTPPPPPSVPSVAQAASSEPWLVRALRDIIRLVDAGHYSEARARLVETVEQLKD